MPFLDSQSACGMRVARFLKAHSLFLVPSCDATLHLRLCSGAFDPRVPRPHSTASLRRWWFKHLLSNDVTSRGVLSSQRTSLPPALCPNSSGFMLASSTLRRWQCSQWGQVAQSCPLSMASQVHMRLGPLAWTRCVHSHAHAWSGPLAAALQARAICHVMSQRRVMRTCARLGALSAAPCVRPRPLLYRLATPCRSRACIHVGPMPALTMTLSVRQRCLKNPLAHEHVVSRRRFKPAPIFASRGCKVARRRSGLNRCHPHIVVICICSLML